MLDNAAVLRIVLGAMENLNEELDSDHKIAISSDTPLFGADAAIDSLSLVSIIVDVEAGASAAMGRDISLTDDRAISQAVSPFTNPNTLTAYILAIAAEGS